MTDNDQTAALLTARRLMVAYRLPPGTSAIPPAGTRRRWWRHLHLRCPSRSLARTEHGCRAALRPAGQVIVSIRDAGLYQSAAAEVSSQTSPMSWCCDDHLTPSRRGRLLWWLGGGTLIHDGGRALSW